MSRREKAAIYVGGAFVWTIIVWVIVAAMRAEGLLVFSPPAEIVGVLEAR